MLDTPKGELDLMAFTYHHRLMLPLYARNFFM